MVQQGTYRMGTPEGRLTAKTSRSGLGARAGHDLVLEAGQWDAVVSVDHEGSATIEVTVDASSLTIREALGGLKPMTSADRKTTEKNMRKVLQPDKYPRVTFTAATPTTQGSAVTAEGELTLLDVTQPLTVSGTVSTDGQVQAEATVTQSRWGITPFSAFFGALRLADDVVITVEAPLQPEG